ncbi:MAG: hypothetical protein HUU38_20580 [Anaerolineales bacterium]|nr:hypothetical protein [Anaerolineales bacterium]
MQQISRIVVAVAILMSGLALLPFVDVPAQTFDWQRYAGVYEVPELVVNATEGRPGSFFNFTGMGFDANSPVEISSNGAVLGTSMTDGAGNLEFNLDTANADQGNYYITATQGNTTITLRIMLFAEAPLIPQEGGGDVYQLPAGLAITEMYLPLIVH